MCELLACRAPAKQTASNNQHKFRLWSRVIGLLANNIANISSRVVQYFCLCFLWFLQHFIFATLLQMEANSRFQSHHFHSEGRDLMTWFICHFFSMECQPCNLYKLPELSEEFSSSSNSPLDDASVMLRCSLLWWCSDCIHLDAKYCIPHHREYKCTVSGQSEPGARELWPMSGRDSGGCDGRVVGGQKRTHGWGGSQTRERESSREQEVGGNTAVLR